MLVNKNEKVYTVRECKNYWSVTLQSAEAVSISYKVNKDLCKDEREITDYITNNDMF